MADVGGGCLADLLSAKRLFAGLARGVIGDAEGVGERLGRTGVVAAAGLRAMNFLRASSICLRFAAASLRACVMNWLSLLELPEERMLRSETLGFTAEDNAEASPSPRCPLRR